MRGLDKAPNPCYNVVIKREENNPMTTKTMMNPKREELLDRVIRVYGMEHEVTQGFAWLCENSYFTDSCLEALCELHEHTNISE